MTDDFSSFTSPLENVSSSERLYLTGSTCNTYVVRIYGKLHFKKILKPEYKGEPQYVEAFKKEFEVGYCLEYSALPKYVALGEEDGCPYILEDYIEGETLSEFLDSNPDYFHSRVNADRFVDELLSAFSYLHDHQVLFLDLKPDNVLITSVGHQLRLVDLGGCHTDAYIGTEQTAGSLTPVLHNDGSSVLDSRGWQPSLDIYLIGKLLQFCKLPPIYNNVIAKCLTDNVQDRYADVESLKIAVGERRHRVMFYKAGVIGGIAVLLLLMVLFLLPRKQLSAPATVGKADTPAGNLEKEENASASIDEKEWTRGEKNDESVAPVQNHFGPTVSNDERLMTGELQREMDSAFKKYIASLPADSLKDEMCVNNHVAMYMDCLNPVVDKLKRKYPNLQPHAVSTKFAEIYSRTVMPIVDRVNSRP